MRKIMRVLTKQGEALYDKLVELADGNREIVWEVLTRPGSKTITLGDAVEEIQKKTGQRPTTFSLG